MSKDGEKVQFSDILTKVMSGQGISFEDISNIDVSSIPSIAGLTQAGSNQFVTIPTPFGMAVGIQGGESDIEENLLKIQQDVINKLTEQVEQLQKQVADNSAENKGLTFPVDFIYSSAVTEGEMSSDREIQDMINELEEVELEVGSFASIQQKDSLVLKIKDNEGITYVVTSGYYHAQPL